MPKRALSALVASTLALGACQTTGGAYWSSDQTGVQSSASNSKAKAAPPDNLKLIATRTTSHAKTAYGAVWEGFTCRNKATDLKIAVNEVTDDGASIVYGAGDPGLDQYNEVLSGSFSQEGRLPSAQFQIGDLLRLATRPDGHMDVRWDGPEGNWCTGVVARTEAPPSS